MNMKREDYIKSPADGLQLSVLTVIPEHKPYRGILQLVHGMSEYKERYLPFMEYMAQHGYVCVIHDHRGHGKSVIHKRDLGYMYGGGAEALLEDIGCINAMAKERYPGIPLILFGHSMGSLAVRAFAREHDRCMDMLIVCGSPSENKARPVGELIAHVEGFLFGKRHKSKLLEAMSLGSYALKFRKDKSCTAWICSDPEVAKEYEASEYCGFTFSDDAYLALFGLMKGAYDTAHWNCTKPDLPVLFVSGAKDPCMTDVRHFAKAVRSMRHAGYLDVKGKLYRGMRHEILNEKGKKKVYRDILIYMKKKGF